jgi:tRNA (guanine-N7-)-methyltransferase
LVGRRRDSLYGRRKGRTLSPRRAALLEAELPRRLVDIAIPPPANLGVLFPHRPQRIRLEIGFGGGEHLLARAAAEPGAGFVGIEPFVEGMAKAVAALAERDMGNVRLYGGDASEFLDWLPSASLDSVDLLYPDPWPKKKHWKRRFVSPVNLDRFARVLRTGGVFRFASDIDSYVNWTLLACKAHGGFAWQAREADDWRKPYAGWPGTRYEAKAFREGRTPAYLTFRRI